MAFSYSITGHWIWASEGWLYNLFKFRDFAGSTVVHSVGGMAGLVGAMLLKPRHERFGNNRTTDRYEVKKTKKFTPHELGFATLGCLILWLGWFGFNGGSAAYLESVPNVIITTMLAAASGGFFALIFSGILWLVIGNILYCFQQKVAQSSKRSNQTVNLFQGLLQFFETGREGIRVSLSDELKGSDDVFGDL